VWLHQRVDVKLEQKEYSIEKIFMLKVSRQQKDVNEHLFNILPRIFKVDVFNTSSNK
jgi:hypothetical protein